MARRTADCASAFHFPLRWWRHAPLRFTKFLVVGGTGVLVNNLSLFVLFEHARLPLLLASILAVEMAIGHNFIWNNRWTFDRHEVTLIRFFRFNLVSLGGLLITVTTLWTFVHTFGMFYLAANMAGIALAAIWNFGLNAMWTWDIGK